MDCSPSGSSVHGDSPGKNIGVGCHALLQRIFLTQGSNPGLPCCRQTIYHESHQGSPRILEWVAYPLSTGTSQPMNRTGVSCITGGFFTSWITREAYIYIYTHTHIYIHTYIHTYIYIHTHIYAYIYVYTHIYVYAHIYMYTHIYIYYFHILFHYGSSQDIEYSPLSHYI